MQYLDLKTQLKDYLIFSIKDIEKVDLSFHKQRLSEWQKKDYVKKICKGFYIFSDLEINEPTLFTIANRVYEPSYVSLEMALSIYGLIPEAVYEVTSVTSRRSKNLKTPIGNFIWRHIQPGLMFGYELREHKGHYYQIAEIEKAVLDYLYFNSKISDTLSFQGMRFNVQELKEKLNIEKFNKYLEAFNNKSLALRAKRFLQFLNTPTNNNA
jgi:predicted transcriptional regulator of viral defense system